MEMLTISSFIILELTGLGNVRSYLTASPKILIKLSLNGFIILSEMQHVLFYPIERLVARHLKMTLTRERRLCKVTQQT